MAKIKLDFGFPLLGPDLQPTGEKAFLVIRNLISFRCSEKPADFLKGLELVQHLNSHNGKVEIDESDAEMIKELIKTHKTDPQKGTIGISDLTKAQLWKAFPIE